jgi:hypothetical protein
LGLVDGAEGAEPTIAGEAGDSSEYSLSDVALFEGVVEVVAVVTVSATMDFLTTSEHSSTIPSTLSFTCTCKQSYH